MNNAPPNGGQGESLVPPYTRYSVSLHKYIMQDQDIVIHCV